MAEESVIDGLVNTFIEYFGVPLAGLFVVFFVVGVIVFYARLQDKKGNG